MEKEKFSFLFFNIYFHIIVIILQNMEIIDISVDTAIFILESRWFSNPSAAGICSSEAPCTRCMI